MPASGPIRPALTELMVLGSKSSCVAFSSSMAAVMPKMKGQSMGVVLKNSA